MAYESRAAAKHRLGVQDAGSTSGSSPSADFVAFGNPALVLVALGAIAVVVDNTLELLA